MNGTVCVLTLCHARQVGQNIFSVTVDLLIIQINVLIKCGRLHSEKRNCCYRHRRHKHTALYKQIISVNSCKIKHFE